MEKPLPPRKLKRRVVQEGFHLCRAWAENRVEAVPARLRVRPSRASRKGVELLWAPEPPETEWIPNRVKPGGLRNPPH